LKGELYVQGSVTGTAPIDNPRTVTVTPVLAGTAGVDVDRYRLLQGGWVPLCSQSCSLGQKQFASINIDISSIFQDGIDKGAPGSHVEV
jgi:hypothetical protein